MPTVFVAHQLGRPILVTSSFGTNHHVVPFRDGSALVAWIGDDLTPTLLDSLPTAEMLLGIRHERAVTAFARLLRGALDDANKLRRLSYGVRFSTNECIVATRDGVWRIDHVFKVHPCAYACIGDDIHQTEALFGDYINACRDSDARYLVIHALHVINEENDRLNGSDQFPEKRWWSALEEVVPMPAG